MQELLARRRTYFGILFISLATLMYEIMLTRIFSVTTWYHFAFLAISLAMLGMTIGSIVVYLNPRLFVREKTSAHMSMSALAFAVLSVSSILVHIFSPAMIPSADSKLLIPFSLFVAVPFLIATFSCSGICVSLCLTRFESQLNRLYATDLAGAALGCLLVAFTLKFLDGVSEIFLIGLFGAISSACFGQLDRSRASVPYVIAAVFAVVVGVNSVSAAQQHPILRIYWSKGEIEKQVQFEKWNCFSRIRVYGDPVGEPTRPVGHPLSPLMPADIKTRILTLDMDGSANTALYQDTGKPTETDFVLYDLTFLPHHLRANADVAVIGVGGGRDILAAVKMHQKSCTGVEINDDILDTLTNRYSAWTNGLAKNPIVALHNDEARSWITRSGRKFDIIQASMVDTYAASSSGAFALTENCLYTVEAWKTFLNHLSDNGILTMSRWYRQPRPVEMHRLTRLAALSLRQIGIADSPAHIMVARSMNSEFARQLHRPDDGFGTILVCKKPFTPQDVKIAQDFCAKGGFDLVCAPGVKSDPDFAAAAADLPTVSGAIFDTAAPTDDRPFFFQMLKLENVLNPLTYADDSGWSVAISGVSLLLTAIATLGISIYCFRLPYLLAKEKPDLRKTAPLFGYFVAVGVGFMLIEISQIYRFSTFLGHPVYALTVCLFAFLLSTGLGSYLLQFFSKGQQSSYRALSIGIIVVLAIAGGLSLLLTQLMPDANTPLRIGGVLVVIFLSGCVMGLAFPMGMKLALVDNEQIGPWLWGANGAGSVCGSVFGTVIAMFAGISFCYWTGVACYVGALFCLTRLLHKAGSIAEVSPAAVDS